MEEEELSNSSVHATIHGSSPHVVRNPDSSSGKKQRVVRQFPSPTEPPVDRISILPEPIIHHILTFLPIKDVIQTSQLAKRWESLWTTVPALCFAMKGIPHKYADFVDKTLILYRSTKVSKFSVSNFKVLRGVVSRVDFWLRFAVLHEAEEICLEFESSRDQYVLPHCLCNASSLKKMSLSFVNLLPTLDFAWGSLKILSIALANLSDGTIEAMLKGSPSLEYLKLQNCKGYSRVNTVFGKCLKELAIDGLLDSGGKRVTIKGPNLLSLSIAGSDIQFKLEDVCLLMEANISFEPKPLGDYGFLQEQYVLIKDMIRNLQGAGTLTLGTCCLQVLSISDRKGLPSPQLTCKVVALNTEVTKWELPGIANLLANAPDVQYLTINMKPACHDMFYLDYEGDFYDTHDFVEDEFWDTEEEIELLQLRNVEIFGLDPCTCNLKLLLELIKFLLKNAESLEKMVIHAEIGTSYGFEEPEQLRNFLRLTRSLLSFQRASPDAVVIFPEV